MENPIKALRLQLDVSRSEMASLLGLCYLDVAHVETGHVGGLPVRVREALADAGMSPEDMDSQYRAWLRDRRDLKRVRQAAAVAG